MLFVPAKDKEAHLTCLLNDLAGSSTIVFTATCDNTLRLALMLRNLTFHVGREASCTRQQAGLCSMYGLHSACNCSVSFVKVAEVP